MKTIYLTKDKYTLVDDDDYNNLNQYKWIAWQAAMDREFYAVRHEKIENNKYKKIKMHRQIMNTPDNMICDHVFRNTLDNRKFIEIDGILKQNLRNCTTGQNQMNGPKRGNKKYKGVYHQTHSHSIYARIDVNRKPIYLGTFKTEKEAAVAYNNAAIKYHGEYACLNII